MADRDADATAAVLRTSARDGLWIAVDGDSMEPSIHGGARVRIEARSTAPTPSTVWAFCNAAGLVVVHRCVDHRDGTSTFRGDSRLRSDPPVPDARLIGELVAVEHDGKARTLATRAPRWPHRVRRAVVRRVQR